jgi:DNA-binding NarL/FixJ family response regulator
VTVRVLLVDDQELVRTGFRMVLDAQPGIEVAGEAPDGGAALEVLRSTSADVVLMDVRMPRLNGVEATRQIQARWPQVRVMMLTTFDDEEYIVEGLYAGAKSYVLKDTSAEQLVQSIEAVHRGESPLTPSVAAKLVARFTRGPEATAPAASNTPSAAQVTAGSGGPHTRPSDSRAPAPGDDLTEREREIVRLLARGDSNREIGEALFITEGTVKNHVSNILSKLGLRDRTQAALWARERGLA